MIVVNYHDDLNEVQGDPALAALLSAPRAAAPFDRIDWWRNLAETCGLAPLIAVARSGADCAVLPLTRKGRSLAGLENWYSFHLAPIVPAGADRHALLAALARDLTGEAPRITLDKLSAADAADLAHAFRQEGWSVWQEQHDTNHVLDVRGRSFADYLAERPGALRTTIKRKSGRLKVELHRSFDQQTFALFEIIYSQSWKPNEGVPAFVRRFAGVEGAAGRLRMGIAYDGDRPVAAQLWTVEAGTAFIHKLAHREDARALSPGSVLSAALFEEVIDRDRVTLVDFGTGNDPYKRDWMERERPRYRLDMVRPSWPGNWPIIARHALRRAARRG